VESPGGPKPTAKSRQKPVTVEAFVPLSKISPGASLDAEIRITVDDGWHINSSAPLGEYLVPTSVFLEENLIAELREIDYPDGEKVKLGFSADEMSVYQGEVTIGVPIGVADTAAGPQTLSLEVRVQPCSDAACVSPQIHVLSIPIDVASDG
jgi:DsbC/DsbD-like thiol-disulfide interchange protein